MERNKMLFNEIYRKLRTMKTLNDEQISKFALIDEMHGWQEKILLRIRALEEYHVELQEKRFEEEIKELSEIKEDEQAVDVLISKEYAELELLREKSPVQYEKNEPTVNQVKEAEDGHTKMPIQTMEMLEQNERILSYE